MAEKRADTTSTPDIDTGPRVVSRVFEGDRTLWIIFTILLVISVLVVYSSTAKMTYNAGSDMSLFDALQKQLMYVMGAVMAIFVVHKINYTFYLRWSRVFYLLCLIGTIATYFVGVEANEAARWLQIGPLSIQPSELLKIATILVLARAMESRQKVIDTLKIIPTSFRLRDPKQLEILRNNTLPLLGPVIFSCGAVLPAHTSSAVIIFVISIIMLYLGRVNLREIAKFCLVIGVVGALGIGTMELFDKGRMGVAHKRIDRWYNEWFGETTAKNIYELSDTQRALIAIHDGGLVGEGAGQSTSRVLVTHPESDYVYAFFIKFNSKTMSLEGTKKTTGSMFDVLPTFEFSASVFKFAGMSMNANGKSTYTFILRDSAITRDVALEISAYNYADDAAPATTNTLTIVVDEDGNFVNTVYPYSLVSGTYMGYVSTTYSHIGTTELDADLFDGYIPRVLKTSWSEYITKYYSPTFSTLDSHEEATSVVLEAVYGDDAKDLPAPSVFLNILGDNISGPFYNWKEKCVDEAGNVINTGYISITVATTEYDENHQITNYEELMAELQAALEKEGFVLSKANTDTTGGASGRANRYVCFIKGNIQIVIENNFTKYLWIYFYKTGDWSLRR